MIMGNVPRALTIAGTDPSGGAGIHADLKTFQELCVYGMSVITAVVSQNTLGVKTFLDMPLELIESQMDAVYEDIRPNAVKTGMLSQSDVIRLVARKMKAYNVDNYVMDPVMVAKSGDALLAETAKKELVNELLPLTTVVTPNLPEAEEITGRTIQNVQQMKDAAKQIVDEFGATAVVVKGGHLDDEARDIYYDGSGFDELVASRYYTKHTHGTGCTFSAAITAELAKGTPLRQAVETAKAYITEAIKHPINLGRGHGPVNHWAYRNRQEGLPRA